MRHSAGTWSGKTSEVPYPLSWVVRPKILSRASGNPLSFLYRRPHGSCGEMGTVFAGRGLKQSLFHRNLFRR